MAAMEAGELEKGLTVPEGCWAVCGRLQVCRRQLTAPEIVQLGAVLYNLPGVIVSRVCRPLPGVSLCFQTVQGAAAGWAGLVLTAASTRRL